MVAKFTLRVLLLCSSLVLAVPNVNSQQSRVRSDPADASTRKAREGLVDFALKRINPSEREYGQYLDETRKFALEQTFNRGYFWSNLSALGLLGVFLIVIVHQQRVQARRELVAAESLTQYHNALARAETQATEATKRNHELMEALTALSESGVRKEPAENSGSKDAPNNKERKRSPTNESTPPVAPAVAATQQLRKQAIAPSSVAKKAPGKDSQQPDQTAVAGNDADLTAKINSLQQQLDTYKQEKQQLLRQVSFAELRLQKEQQKNRSLKGE